MIETVAKDGHCSHRRKPYKYVEKVPKGGNYI